MNVFLFFLNAGFCAVNVWLYLLSGHSYSLGAAVFSGFVALAVLVWDA